MDLLLHVPPSSSIEVTHNESISVDPLKRLGASLGSRLKLLELSFVIGQFTNILRHSRNIICIETLTRSVCLCITRELTIRRGDVKSGDTKCHQVICF